MNRADAESLSRPDGNANGKAENPGVEALARVLTEKNFDPRRNPNRPVDAVDPSPNTSSNPSSSPNTGQSTNQSTSPSTNQSTSPSPNQSTSPSPAPDDLDLDLDLDKLGRQRPDVFPNALYEVFFCSSLLVSMFMAVSGKPRDPELPIILLPRFR